MISISSVAKKLFILALVPLFFACGGPEAPKRVLVFSKTMGFRHSSIETGVEAMKKLGTKNNFLVTATEDASMFNEDSLKQFAAVIFLNTTGDVLDTYQQAFFERYIQAGGGYVGVHAATDTEYQWPWYGKLAGAYFLSHPRQQKADVHIVDSTHPSTDSLPAVWNRFDEWYNFRDINPNIHVLAKLDESSYEGGKNGENHPIAWYHDYDGGRAFYTEMGHTEETYSDPLYLKHVLGGIKYAMGDKPLDYSKATSMIVPEENRFKKVILDYNLDEPTEMAVLPDESILFLERKGNVRLYKEEFGKSKVINTFDVYTGQEDGMMGLAIDPDYANNHWIYIYYSPAGDKPEQHLSRFTFDGETIDMESEKLLLVVKTQRDECCHTGGSIAFGPHGNLFLSTGDDTNPFGNGGFGPMDERPGRSAWDAQRSSGNTNDLRGKILRIKPEADGTYTIPDGNLFAKDAPKTRPEIYVMGNRNPYRISVDQKTGYLYWGEVGPDARAFVEGRGQKGLDELNQAKKAGYFGWPYFTGENEAYFDYDYATKESHGRYDPNNPVNNSPNNTGLTNLPPANKAMVWYSYDESKEFPILGTGGKNPMAGVVYHSDMYPDNPARFPKYFDNKLFFYEWIRSYILLVTMDENGDLEKMEPFMPNTVFSNPMDMDVGPRGNIYMLEYGKGWFTQNMDARLFRIDYEGGNRAPEAVVTSDKSSGVLPLTVQFSSSESYDFDHDVLTYHWDFGDGNISNEVNPTHTFEQAGLYPVKLTVEDPSQKTSSFEMSVNAGNEMAELNLEIAGNNTFYWDGRKVQYELHGKDAEDGALGSGMDESAVNLSIDYMSQPFDMAEIKGHQGPVAGLRGQQLIEGSDCIACHKINEKSIGPSFMDVSKKYKGSAEAPDYLADKIINGGGGVWGEQVMAAHPSMKKADVLEMVAYILSVSDKQKASLPLKGSYVTKDHKKDETHGFYILTSEYVDKGGESKSPLKSMDVKTLRSLTVQAGEGELEGDGEVENEDGYSLVNVDGNLNLTYKNIDLTDINSFTVVAALDEKTETLNIKVSDGKGKELGAGELKFVKVDKATKANIGTLKINTAGTQGMHDLIVEVDNNGNDDCSLVQLVFEPKK